MKRNTLLIKIVTVVFCAAFITGCTKKFEEINTSPTLVTKDKIKPSLLLTSVLKNSVFEVSSQGVTSNFAGFYTNPASGDIFLDRDFGGDFGSYSSYLINIAEIIRLTANDPALSNQNAIARIWKAWLFQRLTDKYGDIPYTDAVHDADNIVLQPKYDKQEDIYKDLLKELKEAAAQLVVDPAKASFGSADILLGGSVDGWKRFANSLRLRMAIRVRYADATLAAQHITEVITGPLIQNNSQNVTLSTLDDGQSDNLNELYSKNLRQPDNMTVSFTVTDNLLRVNDPRLSLFAKPAVKPAPGALYRGAPLQIGGDQRPRYGTDSVSLMGDYFLQPVFDIVVMNAAEVYFLRAEAALASLTSENAQLMYAAGIQAAMDQYGIASSATTTYLASAAGTLTGTTEQKLEQIIVQKWLGIYYNGDEGWAEFRRTGYPRIWTGNVLGDTGGKVPRRFTYPRSEFLQNQASVQEAISRLTGGDELLSRIWWDKKAGLPFAHPKQGMFPPEF